MKVKCHCLICDRKIPIPEDTEFEGTFAETTIWINDHLVCLFCHVFTLYDHTPLRIKVEQIEEELGKKSNETVEQFIRPQRTIPFQISV